MPALLPREKLRAIRQLHYENSCKIMIEFSDRFWTKKHPGTDAGAQPITGGSSITDLPTRQIIYPGEDNMRGRRGGILVVYTCGDDSLRWTALKRDDRIRFALKDIALIHNREEYAGVNILEEIFVSGLSHSWAEDEFTSGAFATFEPYQMTQLFDDIWKPAGNLHFCGEHTSVKHGWIEGAVESAIRVAGEICEQ